MVDERLAPLLAAYLDGSLDPARGEELVALLAEPVNADEVCSQLILDRMLAQSARPPLAAGLVLAAISRGPTVDGVMARVAAAGLPTPAVQPPVAAASQPTVALVARRRRFPAPRRLGLALAASLAVAAGAAVWAWHLSAQPMARLVGIDAALTVRRGDRVLRLEPSTALMPGDALASAGDHASFAYADGSTIQLRAGAEVRLDAAGEGVGKHLTLERGEIVAEVAPQPAGRPLEVLTPHAVATVVGTRFSLLVAEDPGATRLEVEHGLVRLADRQGAAPIAVAAGRTGIVRAGEAALLLPPRRARAAVVAAADTDATLRPGERPGAGHLLRCSTSAADGVRVAYLRFDVDVPGAVTDAVLSLQSVEGLGDAMVYLGEGTWDEDAIDPARLPRRGAAAVTGFSARDGIAEIDVGAAVENHRSITFVIVGDGAFASREAVGAEPVLTVDYQP